MLALRDSACQLRLYEDVSPLQVHFYDSKNPWQDLKARLSRHRRIFGFFHGSMPEEPLVVLHTALMKDITSSVKDILGSEGEHHICPFTHAPAKITYSILQIGSWLELICNAAREDKGYRNNAGILKGIVSWTR